MEYSLVISSNSMEWRECLAAAFKSSDLFHVLGAFPTSDIIKTASDHYPDVVLCEVNSDDTLPVISKIKDKSPFSRLVIVLRNPSNYNMLELVRFGIKGCLPVRLLPKQIVHAVELIVDAGVLCLPRFGPEYNGSNNSSVAPPFQETLTRREQEVLASLSKGHSNEEIASTLFISKSTVKSHLRSIFRKLEVRNRNEAQALALQLSHLGDRRGIPMS